MFEIGKYLELKLNSLRSIYIIPLDYTQLRFIGYSEGAGYPSIATG